MVYEISRIVFNGQKLSMYGIKPISERMMVGHIEKFYNA